MARRLGNNLLVKLLTTKLEPFVEATLIVAHVLTMQVNPIGDSRQSTHPPIDSLNFDS